MVVTAAQQNGAVGASLFLVVSLFAVFFATLFGVTNGEVVSALGGVVGGLIGAGGAGFSVVYSIRQQRKNEIDNASYAVLTEMAVLTKYIVGHLDFCELIKAHNLKFPRSQLLTVLGMPDLTIYKAVADKVSYFPRPTQVVEFYTRLGEIPSIATMVINSPFSDIPYILPEETNGLADLFITQCQIVEALLANTVHDTQSEAVLSGGLRSHMLAALHQQLEQAKTVWPKSEAFGGAPDPSP